MNKVKLKILIFLASLLLIILLSVKLIKIKNKITNQESKNIKFPSKIEPEPDFSDPETIPPEPEPPTPKLPITNQQKLINELETISNSFDYYSPQRYLINNCIFLLKHPDSTFKNKLENLKDILNDKWPEIKISETDKRKLIPLIEK